MPSEDDLVLPFVKGNKYDFFPLKGGDEIMKLYGVRGTPMNFLIGPDARIYFRPRVHSTESQRTLELEIESLLAQESEGKDPM